MLQVRKNLSLMLSATGVLSVLPLRVHSLATATSIDFRHNSHVMIYTTHGVTGRLGSLKGAHT